jgi:hypothetical protein
MADFSAQDKFDPSKGFTGVKFGADTELLEVELNEMQKIQNEQRAMLGRSSSQSGVLDWNDITFRWNVGTNDKLGEVQAPSGNGSFALTNDRLNLFVTQPFNVLINGHTLYIEGYDKNYSSEVANFIRLPEPPTEGERTDLVFLEAWFDEVKASEDGSIIDSRFGVETSRREKLRYRFRVVEGVDDSFHKDGLGYRNTGGLYYAPVIAQGGNEQPIENPYPKSTIAEEPYYTASQRRSSSVSYRKRSMYDDGLYIAGSGTQASKDKYKTADGFVYAIPLFLVSRRNSGGFSADNPNGAIAYYGTNSPLNPGKTSTVVNEVEGFKVGDKIGFASTGLHPTTITAIDTASKRISYEPLWEAGEDIGGGGNWSVMILSDRPDKLYSNIVDEKDIRDLRYRASLSGVNLKQVLRDSVDNLLKGNLQSKKRAQFLKTYHGLRKTPVDSNTVVYASFDGANTAEVGNFAPTVNGYKPMPTGLGALLKEGVNQEVTFSDLSGDFTLDLWFYLPELPTTSATLLNLFDSAHPDRSGIELWARPDQNSQLQIQQYNGTDIYSRRDINAGSGSLKVGYTHVRITVNRVNRTYDLYLDGKLVSTDTFHANVVPDTLILNGYKTNKQYSLYTLKKMAYADVSLSKTYKGSDFATLPKDLSLGRAKVAQAFNRQRRNFSDAQMSLAVVGIAKPKAEVSDRGITVTKGTGTNNTIWEEGDKLAVKGLVGEFVASSPSPVVQWADGETVKTVTGTWSGLGTAEATFTLGANTNLDTEKIRIKYTLLTERGQGGMPEVVRNVFGGEFKGQKLQKVYSPAIRASYKGKVAGSDTVVPHSAYFYTGDVEPNPKTHQMSEFATTDPYKWRSYDLISELSTETAGARTTPEKEGKARHIFKINVFRLFEDMFGADFFADCLTTAEKRQKVLDETSLVTFYWWGKGVGRDGNKAYISNWRDDVSEWSYPNENEQHTESSSYAKRIGISMTDSLLKFRLTSDGFMYYMAYTDPTVVPTIDSQIDTNMAYVDVKLKTPEGYEVVAPDTVNTFVNGTTPKQNVLYVRSETKEVMSILPYDNETSGLVSYTDYVPYQGIGGSATIGTLVEAGLMEAVIGGTGSPLGGISKRHRQAVEQLPNSPTKTQDYKRGNGAFRHTTGGSYEARNFRVPALSGVASTHYQTDFASERLTDHLGKRVVIGTPFPHSKGMSQIMFSLTDGVTSFSGYYYPTYNIVDGDKYTLTPDALSFTFIEAFLFVQSGEILLGIINAPSEDLKTGYFYGHSNNDLGGACDAYVIPGRPLMRGGY